MLLKYPCNRFVKKELEQGGHLPGGWMRYDAWGVTPYGFNLHLAYGNDLHQMFRIERSRDATTLAALSAAQIASSLNAEADIPLLNIPREAKTQIMKFFKWLNEPFA